MGEKSNLAFRLNFTFCESEIGSAARPLLGFGCVPSADSTEEEPKIEDARLLPVRDETTPADSTSSTEKNEEPAPRA